MRAARLDVLRELQTSRIDPLGGAKTEIRAVQYVILRTGFERRSLLASHVLTNHHSARPRSTIRERVVRVLVVDDDVDSADMAVLVLEGRGHTACVAYTAEHALELAQSFEPEVALLDLSLGARSGYELAEDFRSHPSLLRCRFVALTGNTEETARRQSEAAGFHRHLTKPVDVDALFEAIAGTDERPTCAPASGWSKG